MFFLVEVDRVDPATASVADFPEVETALLLLGQGRAAIFRSGILYFGSGEKRVDAAQFRPVGIFMTLAR